MQVALGVLGDDRLHAAVGGLITAATELGNVAGFNEACALIDAELPRDLHSLHGVDVTAKYKAMEDSYDTLNFPLLEQVAEIVKEDGAVSKLKALLEPDTGATSSSAAGGGGASGDAGGKGKGIAE